MLYVIELQIRIVVLNIFHACVAVCHDKDKLLGSTLQHNEPQINVRSSAYYGTSTAPLLSKPNDPQISVRSSAYYGTSTAPLLSKPNEIETAVASTPADGERAPSRVTHSEGRDSSLSALGRDEYSKPKLASLGSFSLRELSSAISESEKTRLCFSAIISFLVVASYVGFPFLGQSLMRIVFGSRPLYLLLLTNLTVVLGRLLFTKQKGFRASNRGQRQVTPPEEQSSVEQIGKILEVGLVAQKAMGAIFMDCSVFSVIVVSGLSLVQQL